MTKNMFKGRAIQVVAQYGVELGGMVLGQEIAASQNISRKNLLDELANVKNALGGEFRVMAQGTDGGVLIGKQCPFGDVEGQTALCRVTQRVFEHLSRQVAPFAQVTISKTIAGGCGRCEVEISLCEAGREHRPNLHVVGTACQRSA